LILAFKDVNAEDPKASTFESAALIILSNPKYPENIKELVGLFFKLFL
jgi:hypothetical protein